MSRKNTLLIAAMIIAMLSGTGFAIADPVATPAPQVSDSYIIHGGDELSVIVYNQSDLSQNVTVLPSGTISCPLIGEIHIGGLTPPQAGAAIASELRRYVREPRVSVIVTKEGPLEVLVIGAVTNPGRYELASRSRLTDALASAGGLGPTDGRFPSARIADSHGRVTQVPLDKLLHDGDTALNVPLADEMTVYVPSPLTLQVQVLGAVDKPGDIVVHQGDRLSMALAKAGTGTNSYADLNHVTIRRVAPDGSAQTMNVNLYAVLHSGDISGDPVLQKNDLVFVPQSSGHGHSTLLSIFSILSAF